MVEVNLRPVGDKIILREVGRLDKPSSILEIAGTQGTWEPWNYKLEILAIGATAAEKRPDLSVGDVVVIENYRGDSVWAEEIDGRTSYNYEERGVRLIFARDPENIVARIDSD